MCVLASMCATVNEDPAKYLPFVQHGQESAKVHNLNPFFGLEDFKETGCVTKTEHKELFFINLHAYFIRLTLNNYLLFSEKSWPTFNALKNLNMHGAILMETW